jgi:phosphoglycolate phosphatase
MAIRAILFDLDGTLIDSSGDLTTAVNRMRASFGIGPLPEATVRRCVGDGVAMLVRRALADAPSPVDEAEAIARMRKFYLANLAADTRLYPGVTAGLAALRDAGVQLGVVTNKPEDAALAVLKLLKVDGFFAGVVGAGVLPLKPAPDGCRELLRRFGVAPAEAVMLGDHHTDLDAAAAAGIRAVLAGWGIGRADEAPYEYCAADFADFVRYIFQIYSTEVTP